MIRVLSLKYLMVFVANAPEGYIELMQKCWHPDPNKRPSASDIWNSLNKEHMADWQGQIRSYCCHLRLAAHKLT